MEQSIILARHLVQLAHRVESASLGLGRGVVTGAGDDYERYPVPRSKQINYETIKKMVGQVFNYYTDMDETCCIYVVKLLSVRKPVEGVLSDFDLKTYGPGYEWTGDFKILGISKIGDLTKYYDDEYSTHFISTLIREDVGYQFRTMGTSIGPLEHPAVAKSLEAAIKLKLNDREKLNVKEKTICERILSVNEITRSFGPDLNTKLDDIAEFITKKYGNSVQRNPPIADVLKSIDYQIDAYLYTRNVVGNFFSTLWHDYSSNYDNLSGVTEALLTLYADTITILDPAERLPEDQNTGNTIIYYDDKLKLGTLYLKDIKVKGTKLSLNDLIFKRFNLPPSCESPSDYSKLMRITEDLEELLRLKLGSSFSYVTCAMETNYSESEKKYEFYLDVSQKYRQVIVDTAALIDIADCIRDTSGSLRSEKFKEGLEDLIKYAQSKKSVQDIMNYWVKISGKSPTSKTPVSEPKKDKNVEEEEDAKIDPNLKVFPIFIDGIKVIISNFDKNVTEHWDRLEKFKEVVRRFKSMMKRKAPALLDRLPEIWFECSKSHNFTRRDQKEGRAAGTYHRRGYDQNPALVVWGSIIDYYPLAVTVHTMAHECGHHWYKEVLTDEKRDLWNEAINGTRMKGEINIQRVLDKAKEHNTQVLSRLMEVLMQEGDAEDRLLGLRLAVVNYYTDHMSHISSLSDLQQRLSDGETVLKCPRLPITPYGDTKPEEGFCEAVGNYIAYGRRAVDEFWLKLLEICLGARKMNIHAEAEETLSEILAKRLFVLSKYLA